MALKIRLARGGAKKRPFYRIVVAENTAPRDGRFVERLGSYNPLLPKENKERIVVNADRVKYWMSIGAVATDRVLKLLSELGVSSIPMPSKATKKQTEQIVDTEDEA
jgi:small subunit ribosomal protein S16